MAANSSRSASLLQAGNGRKIPNQTFGACSAEPVVEFNVDDIASCGKVNAADVLVTKKALAQQKIKV
jgi:hypothetical protein